MPRVKVFEERKCVICETPFQVNIKSKRDSKKKTCSNKCSSKLGSLNSQTKTNCRICGKEIYTNKGHANSDHGVYCSDECRKKRYELNCVICGNKFYADRNTVNHCSQECINESNKNKLIEVECYCCKRKFKRPTFTIPEGKRIFCSTKCCNRQFSIENPNRYGSKWSRIRQDRLKIDNHTCLKCGKRTLEKYALNVHHIIPIEEFDDVDKANELDNLQTLCYECHMEHHGRHIIKNEDGSLYI